MRVWCEPTTSREYNRRVLDAMLPLCQTPVSTLSPHSCPVSLERLWHYNVSFNKMDSNSNSSDNYLPKIEIDSENEKETSFKRLLKFNWTSENTMKLIECMEKECKELWDTKNPSYRDRLVRQRKLEFLGDTFGTTSEEISRKIHNLRSQFNNELRKIKRRQSSTGEGTALGGSGWEYFDALSFLLREPICDPLDCAEGVNMEVNKFDFYCVNYYSCLYERSKYLPNLISKK